MLISCTNKGCYALDEHLLDQSENKLEGGNVICIECGGIVNVPRITKNVLKSLGQIRREAKNSLKFPCKDCGHKGAPNLVKQANGTTTAHCQSCQKPLKIHPSFIEALKVIGANGEKAN